MTLTQNGAQCASSHPAASSLLGGTPAIAALSSNPGACSGESSTPEALGESTPLCPAVAASTQPQTAKGWPTARRGGRLSPQWRQILNALLEPAPAVVQNGGVTFSARKTQAQTAVAVTDLASTHLSNTAEVNRG
jgi:hypothetical protein